MDNNLKEYINYLTVLDLCGDAAYKAVTEPIYFISSDCAERLNLLVSDLTNDIKECESLDLNEFAKEYLQVMQNKEEVNYLEKIVNAPVVIIKNFQCGAGKVLTQEIITKIIQMRIEHKRIVFVFSKWNEIDIMENSAFPDEIKHTLTKTRKFQV